MTYFFFIDESGYDFRESPYAVLASVAIEDRDLWNFIQSIQEAEIKHFGTRYSDGTKEFKGRKILKRKTFRLAQQLDLIPLSERSILAKSCLEYGNQAGQRELTALAQSKLELVKETFDICSRYRCKVFASILSRNAPYPPDSRSSNYLRKDYAYLFERFFYFLEDMHNPSIMGIVVFDELEKTESHLLVGQMDRYFKRTVKGKQMSNQIIPEPFFVHSDLTTGIQIADLVAYIVSWAWNPDSTQPVFRQELDSFMQQICNMRYRTVREINDDPNYPVWSFVPIDDLRTRDMQEENDEE